MLKMDLKTAATNLLHILEREQFCSADDIRERRNETYLFGNGSSDYVAVTVYSNPLVTRKLFDVDYCQRGGEYPVRTLRTHEGGSRIILLLYTDRELESYKHCALPKAFVSK